MSSRWRLVRARRDAVPGSVRRFSERARRRRMQAVRPWLIALGGLALAATAVGLVYATPLLGVAEIRVAGARLLTADEVRSAAGVARGTPLARVDGGAVSRRVARLAPVSRVEVTRRWPRTLVVRIVERTPAAVVPSGGQFAVLDRQGVVFDRVAQRPAGLPVLKLTGPGADDQATRAALTVLAALPPELRDPMKMLVADAPARIRLELADGRQVIWGDATQNDMKARVALALLARGRQAVDVSAPTVIPDR